MSRTLVVSIALVLALGAGALAVPSKEKVAMAKDAKVELSDAVTKATAKSPGRAIEVELGKKNGKVVWEVEVLANDKVNEVDIDAKTGDVVDTEPKK